MKNKSLIEDIILTFMITLLTAILVTFLWNLIIERSGYIIDWGISFVMAIILGIALPLAGTKDK